MRRTIYSVALANETRVLLERQGIADASCVY